MLDESKEKNKHIFDCFLLLREKEEEKLSITNTKIIIDQEEKKRMAYFAGVV
jgi:hypothetical protein